MDAKKAVDNFMYYMYNKWSESECRYLFKDVFLADHIWAKYKENGNAILWWYSMLDSECQRKLIDRANHFYGE